MGKVPIKGAEMEPWRDIATDLLGPWKLGCIFLFHVPSRGGEKRRGKIQFSGNSSFPFPFPFFSVPFGCAKRNTQFEENRRKRKS